MALSFALRSRSQPQQKCFGERRTASFPGSTSPRRPDGGVYHYSSTAGGTSHIYNSHCLSLAGWHRHFCLFPVSLFRAAQFFRRRRPERTVMSSGPRIHHSSFRIATLKNLFYFIASLHRFAHPLNMKHQTSNIKYQTFIHV